MVGLIHVACTNGSWPCKKICRAKVNEPLSSSTNFSVNRSSTKHTAPKMILTQAGDDVLSKLTECWDEILARPIPLGSTEKWRWQWDRDRATPVRFRPSVIEARIKFKNKRW